MMRRGNSRRNRSLVHALAQRERDGVSSQIERLLPRVRWTMDQVLSLEDCAVLLGFSCDGQHLVYYSLWEASYIVLWKRIRSPFTADRPDLSMALRLHCGKHEPMARTFGGDPNVGSRLRVWQSADDHLVAVVVMDSPMASQDTGPSYHFTLSPAPSFALTRGCARTASLSFSYTLPSPAQEVEAWQLLTMGDATYLMVLNMGSSVMVMALYLRHDASSAVLSTVARHARANFQNCDWYAPPEFPIEFKCDEFADNQSISFASASLECLGQHEFDCEAFLASFFHKYAAFRHLHLVDYDLRLVRTNLYEKALYLTCTADLESSPSISSQRIEQSRLALFFTFEIYTGKYHVVRALKVPRHQPLRHLSVALARKFLLDSTERSPVDTMPMEWNNDPVARGQSLDVVHNTRFSVSIYLK